MNRIYRFFGVTNAEDISQAIRSFSLTQKLLWILFLALFFGSILNVIRTANDKLLVEVPTFGGSYAEGVIGVPRFINPVLASSDADRDVTALVYSGLMRVSPDGTLIPDLASNYEISEDGLTYTFTLRDGLTWHDGAAVTTEDVEFTVQKIQDTALKSPRQANWSGITIERKSATEVIFHLKQPFSGFLENATVGIMPKHLWKDLNAEAFPFSTFNIEAIGSGPYKISNITHDSSGIPDTYTMTSFANFALGQPKISEISLHFYPNEDKAVDALKGGTIQALAALSPELVEEIKSPSLRVQTSTLPRVFAVFFNQNQAELFSSKAVRQALDLVLDKNAIVDTVLKGYGVSITGPIPPGSIGFVAPPTATTTPSVDERILQARTLLVKDGWRLNTETNVFEKFTVDAKTKKETKTGELAFSLATGAAPGLKQPAEEIAATWKKLGANVELKVYETSDLNQSVIRTRKYDALFFGEIVGRDPDLFSFWHSSQRNDPGLNIALYTSITADKLLADTRTTADVEKRIELYDQITDEIQKDAPAVFLYSPEFLYALPVAVKNVEMSSIVTNAERFSNSYKWYIATEKVWNIFLK